MKPRYVIIDKSRRDRFEKEWQLPYGYGGCRIFLDAQDAVDELKRVGNDFIIERHQDGIKEELIL